MRFNLNEFLMSISFALDFIEIDVLGRESNHGKRVAYICLNIARQLGMSFEEIHDLAALAILHDNGLSEKSLHDKVNDGAEPLGYSIEKVKEHCIVGENNLIAYPFLTDAKNVIMYHHEVFNGTGFFSLQADSIPLMSQIIQFADWIEISFNLQNDSVEARNEVFREVKNNEQVMFSKSIVDAFLNMAGDNQFWLNIKNEVIDTVVRKNLPNYSMELSYEEIHNVTQVLSKIIDSKSKYTQLHSSALAEKIRVMADYYNMGEEEKMKLVIAADLHDIGKLAVPNSILDSNKKLSKEEFDIIKKHPYYTRIALQEITGFEDITGWAANHHEKLNGEGYPLGLTAEKLDFNSRLMGCLDIYQALTEERPYRRELNHKEAMDILDNMKDNGFIDANITEDIDKVFKAKSFDDRNR